jgi:serine/threonine protein kinase
MATPTLIGRYEIVAELGRGAMGSVFKALDPAVGRTVALKTIHSAALSGEQAGEYRARFYREARASGGLAHPGIVPVFDVGEHDGAPYLVMEFVDGRTLDSAIKKGERFTLDRVCEIGQQLAEALGYAHRRGVVHRDVKPANILLTSREIYGIERPRITDFGIAKLAASEITTTGQLLGTPSYMPPEQFTGAPIDGRADLFSLGVILYSLASGEQPFPGETMTAVSYKVVYTDPVPPAKLNPAIPAGLETVILKCLAKSPANRYQTGEELAQDLATLRANPNASILLPVAPAAKASSDPNATLAAAPSHISHPPAHGVGTDQTPTASKKPAPPAAKKPSKPIKLATVVESVVAVAAIAAGAWYLVVHHQQPVPTPSPTISKPSPQPVAINPGPAPVPLPPPEPTPDSGDKKTQPITPEQAPKTKPSPAKPQTTAVKTTPPPAPVTTAQTTPPPPAKPATPSTTQPPTTAAPKPPTPSAPAATTTDPHKLDPNSNAKFKIELSKIPNGLPFTVEMNKDVYLRFISGDKTDLNNLYVPPGVQNFHVIVQSGGQQISSNIVSSEFKAKKKKNLKIELRNQGTVPAGSTSPLSPGAQIFISLSSPLF